jgi:hypothetical protein
MAAERSSGVLFYGGKDMKRKAWSSEGRERKRRKFANDLLHILENGTKDQRNRLKSAIINVIGQAKGTEFISSALKAIR